ncbi:peptide synthetase [Xylaria bambusicola]|uniref:peptide synthetase n=1 Tax=Xylaria bambusicola TaxID=326684 RepID=UPI0020079576|nr:peptide synthetase [Xylaria bambusicola]KAI0517347.1 peptide synthetase [Xylaria bambusicola]
MTPEDTSNTVAQLLLNLYAEVLLISEDQIGPEDSFIGLGGDSFKAIKLKRKCDQLGIRLSLREILARKSIASLSAGQVYPAGRQKRPKKVKQKTRARLGKGRHEKFNLMPQDYAWDLILEGLGFQNSIWSTEALDLVENVYPCSPMQESIYVARETKGKQLYRIHELFELGPCMTLDKLESAWHSVVDLHESLRTIFVPSTDVGSSRLLDAVVLKRRQRCDVERIKCSDHDAVIADFEESCFNPQDIQGPPHRLTIYCTEDGRQFCQLDLNHMISDGSSLINIVNEICTLANGSVLSPVPGYSSVVKYNQSAQLSDESLCYWKSYLDGIKSCNFPSLSIETQVAEQNVPDRYQVVEIPFNRHKDLSEFCAKMEITMSTALQAAWAILLRAYTGNEEVCFAYTASGRDIAVDGADKICGPLVNLVLRRATLLEATSIKSTVDTIQQDYVNSLQHQSVPFMHVQQLFKTTEKMFNTILTVQYAPLLVDENKSMPLRRITSFNATEFLSIHVTYSDTVIKTKLTYPTKMLSTIMAERVMKTFLSIIDHILDATDVDVPIGRLGQVSSSDLQQVMEWNTETLNAADQYHPNTTATVHGLIEAATIRAPNSPAIYFSGETFSYDDLNTMSTTLSQQILKSSSDKQSFIPLLFEKSPIFSIALLAVMKSGKAFVPIDISSPPDRIRQLFEQLGITSSAGLVICSEGMSDQVRSLCQEILAPSLTGLQAEITQPQTQNISALLPVVHPSDPAYLIFTSGSTGTPKGVTISHSAYVHASRHHASGIQIDPSSRVLQFASYSFDTSMEDHLTSLIVGACLCVPKEIERDTALVEFINTSGANWVHITPSMMVMIPPVSVPKLRTVVLGGEAMTTENVTEWAIPGRRLVQVYGPSECSVTSTINPDVSRRRDPTNIGRAFAGCATWITDVNNPNILCPIGSIGELLMEGPILAQGYLGLKSVTDSAFITNAVWRPGTRLYRTGDLVRYDETGDLHFVGRTDSRVKIRGQRIECGEIESQLRKKSSVRHAVVVVPKSGPGKDRLVAVVSMKLGESNTHPEPASGDIQLEDVEAVKTTETPRSLQDWLTNQLPAYMIPDLFILVRSIPMNSSKKLDRKQVFRYLENLSQESYKALFSRMDEETQDRPGTDLEHSIKRVWCRVLNVSESAVNWNTSWFFSGGDSISAMMLSSELRKESIKIPASDILRLRNIERIVVHIQETVVNDGDAKFRNVDFGKTDVDTSWDLSPIQQLSFQFHSDGDHFDQQTMVVDTSLTISDEAIIAALDAVVKSHPMLHANFIRESSAGAQVWKQRVVPIPPTGSAYIIRFHQDTSTNFKLRSMSETKARIDLIKGPMMGVDIFRSASSATISISVHHLVVDMVSWRIIFQELEDVVTEQRSIPPEPISFQSWCQVQNIYAQSIQTSRVLPEDKLEVDISYWSMEKLPNLFGDAITTTFEIGSSDTADLLDICNKLEYSVVDVLCAAITTSFSKTFQTRSSPVIFVEGHGRESPSGSIDLSRTVGWFTTFAPVAVRVPHDKELSDIETLDQIKNFREATPSKGLDYFTCRFLSQEGSTKYRESHAHAEIVVNFLGMYQQFERSSSAFKRSNDPELLLGLSAMRREQRKKSERYSLISIVAMIKNGSLSVEIEWNKHMRFQSELTSWPLKIQDDMLLLIRDLTRISSSLRSMPAPQSDVICFGVDRQKTLAKITGLGLRPHGIESMYPCSPMQQGLMASLLRDSGTSSAYNQTFLLKINPTKGSVVKSEQVVESWRRTVQRHAILRTIFVETDVGDYSQVVLHHADPVVQIKDGASVEDLRTTLFETENQSLNSPLDGVPLHRILVCEATDKSTYMLLTKSHLLTDGTSTQILIQDLAQGCGGVEMHDKPQNHYLDYVRYVTNQDKDLEKSYWASYLRSAAPCNFPRLSYASDDPNAKVSHSSVTLQLHAPEADVKQLCRNHDLTTPSIFQLAWTLVLRTYLNSEDILFGLLSSGRDLPVAGIQKAVGPVANMLVMRSNIRSNMKTIDVAKGLQADYIEHLSRQTLPLSQVLHAAREGNRAVSFNTILNIQKAEGLIDQPTSEDFQIEFVKSIDTTEYGLAMTVLESQNQYKLSLEYETGLISPKMADAVASTFAGVVRSVIANPECLVGDLDLVGDNDREQIQKWDINNFQTKNECVHRLFQATALSMPEKHAIHSWDGSLTYGELEALTSKLARRLLDLSVQPEEIIPLCFEKSVWGIVAMLSVIKAGATFVHIDPSSPASRKQQITRITNPRLALVSSNTREVIQSLVPHTLIVDHDTLAENGDVTNPPASIAIDSRVDPSNALYIIFTSGSTGEPKGVVIEHRNFCSAMAANSDWLQILPSSRLLQFSSFVFDACMEEILTALVVGACVCVPSDDDRMSPERLTSFIQEAGVNWAALTPSFLQTLNPDNVVPPLKFITVHAEAMNASLTRLWSPRVHMRPSYGPTECTVTSTVGAAFSEFSDPSNIGWPVGCHGRVTDPQNPEKLMPIGAIGELTLEGPILARGYFNRPAETEKAFPNIEDWFDGRPKKVYRTGDLVRYADDGSLRILGRRDAQIKVRGQRVELGEIQSQLDLSPEIHHSMVMQPKSGVLGSRLVVVLSLTQLRHTPRSRSRTIRLVNDPEVLNKADHSSVSEALKEIRSFVSAKLPSYMVPNTWCVVEDIPTLASFKLDRKLVNQWLETMDEKTLLLTRQLMSSSRGSGSGTDTEAEKLVRSAWSQVLAIPGDLIDKDDHFIALGGDSISAMNVSRFLSQAGSPVKTQDVLRSNSIRELALALETWEAKDLTTDVRSRNQPRGSRKALSVDEVLSEYGFDPASRSKILSVHQSTPFQSRTTSSLHTLPWRPYLYNLFAEIGGYQLPDKNPDPERLLSAWKATVARHAILRTAIPFTKDGSAAYQFILNESAAACGVFEVATEEMALKASIEKTEHVRSSLSSTTLTPPLWLDLYVTSTKQVYMHLLMGHMLIDHVSLAHVLYDWDVFYRGASSLLTDVGRLPRFASYLDDVESRDLGASTGFWTRKLRRAKPTILGSGSRSADHGAKPAHGADAMSVVRFRIDIDAAVDQYCRNARVTVSTLLQFAWAILLSAYTGQTSVCFGHLASDRDVDIPDADEIVGPMLTVLVAQVDLESPIQEAICKLQDDNTDSMTHKVFDLSAVERNLGLQLPESPLFNTLVNYRKVKRSGPEPVMKLRSILKQDPHEQQIILSFNELPDAAVLDGALTLYNWGHSGLEVQKMADVYAAILALVVSGECQAADELASLVTSLDTR